LPASATIALATTDKLLILSRQSKDAQMLALAAGVLADATLVARQLAANASAGLEDVKRAQAAVPPTGIMDVQEVTVGAIKLFGYTLRWFTAEALANITVRNTGTVAATYWLSAVFPKRFTTSQLFPTEFLGIGARAHDIHVLYGPFTARLAPGQATTLSIHFLTQEGGQLPRSPVLYTLLAVTDDGTYAIQQQSRSFGTTFIDLNGQVLKSDDMESMTLTPIPVRAALTLVPTADDQLLTVHALNPLEVPLLMDVRQELPAGAEVVSTGDATLAGNSLVWELNLPPAASQTHTALLRLTAPLGAADSMPTAFSLHDQVNQQWLTLQTAPAVLGADAPTGLRIAGVRLSLSEGRISFRWTAQAGRRYRVQYKESLNDGSWQDLPLTPQIDGDAASVSDALDVKPSRFYRIIAD
jgi:hypothetical protein